MSSQQQQQQQLPAAPKWKSTFLEHISTMDSPTFVFTTLDTILSSDAAAQPTATTIVPRARYCVFRGFWAELPENKHNTADLNPRVYESEMPAFTTDVRMEKVRQLFGVGKKDGAGADDGAALAGSGGGAPIEAVWWMEKPATQWRIQGSAYVIARDMENGSDGDGDGDAANSAGIRAVKREVGARMRCVQPGKEAEWSWVRELHGHFGNNSPGLRGSFRGPPPGKPVSTPHDDELKLGTKVKELDDPVALRHFRVVVIKPEVVEQTDLSDPDNSRRYRYTFDVKTSDWSMEELWP